MVVGRGGPLTEKVLTARHASFGLQPWCLSHHLGECLVIRGESTDSSSCQAREWYGAESNCFPSLHLRAAFSLHTGRFQHPTTRNGACGWSREEQVSSISIILAVRLGPPPVCLDPPPVCLCVPFHHWLDLETAFLGLSGFCCMWRLKHEAMLS